MAGYSGTPLVRKLGIKEGFRIKTKNAPVNYLRLLEPLPANVHIATTVRGTIDMWHMFISSREELNKQLVAAKSQIKPEGMIWVSWPKKASGVRSDVTEDTIREYALTMGLVDVKVCAVDEVWSGLKLVWRKELRPVL
ncbi:MAG: DUF3052 family protein [Planctomycetales bacterium]|nr:DUF3052 family protein [Planctomycetales bacterium]